MATFSMLERARYSAEDYAAASKETQDEILVKQAAILVPAQERYAASILNEAGMSRGITSKTIKAGVPKTSRHGYRVLSISFEGTRSDGGSVRRTAEVAFLNEFGVPGKHMTGRRFISRANEEKADECAEVAADIFVQYVADQIQI